MTTKDRALAWWFARSERERWLLAAMAAMLALVMVWYGVVAPLRWASDAAVDRRERAGSGLALTANLAPGPAGKRSTSPQTLAQIVDASAAASGIAIDRRREDADGRLTVWIGAVEPKTLMQWIVNLRKGHGVAVVALTASKVDASSLEVELSFTGAGQ